MTDFEERQQLATDFEAAVAAYQEKFGMTRTLVTLYRLQQERQRVLDACMQPGTAVVPLFP